jgi:3'-phosphoadenosine 5'-phosphosulfate sulfotransferase (PAPS reductase)/FAD synthetase
MQYFDLKGYGEQVVNCKEITEFEESPSVDSARALSLKMFDIMHDCLSPGSTIILNSSTGKDSTVLTAMYWINAKCRISAGKVVHPCKIFIADTLAEFPSMTERMYSERDAINKKAEQNGLDIHCEITIPVPRDSLLVQLIGNGTFLPTLKNAGTAGGAGNWCVDRVKQRPLKALRKRLASNFKFYIQTAGVRSDESQKRKKTIERYTDGLPFGLTTFSDSVTNSMGFMPIVHWKDLHVRNWMDRCETPWSIMSGEKLRQIYEEGAPPGKPGEVGACAMVVTKEGMTNICSDLGGARFGCFFCLKSKNKSMKYTAQRNPRYKWLRAFDRYVKYQHRIGDIRRKMRDKYGFNRDNMFPKGFTLKRRMDMLLLLFRAELESGYTLITEVELDAIRTMWQKHGLYSIDPEWIREDARYWMEEGEIRRSYDLGVRNTHELNHHISEGIPMCAYYNILDPEATRHHKALTNLYPLLNIGSPMLPMLQTYMFEDPRKPNLIIHMVSDTPAFIGAMANTTMLNGLSPTAWVYKGVRDPSPWEEKMSMGRCLFYTLDKEELHQRVMDFLPTLDLDIPDGTPMATKKREIPWWHYNAPVEFAYLRSLEGVFNGGRRYDCIFTDQYQKQTEIQELKGKIKYHEYIELYEICVKLVSCSNVLEDYADVIQRKIKDYIDGRWDMLDAKLEEGQTKEAEKFRKKFRAWTREEVDLRASWDLCCEYIEAVQSINRWLLTGKANVALVGYTINMVRLGEHKHNEVNALIKLLDLKKEKRKRGPLVLT